MKTTIDRLYLDMPSSLGSMTRGFLVAASDVAQVQLPSSNVHHSAQQRRRSDNRPDAAGLCHQTSMKRRIFSDQVPVDLFMYMKYDDGTAEPGGYATMMSSEDEVELLKQQLSALTGSSQEVGVLVGLKFGMTLRNAEILTILIKRSPAVVSRDALHRLFYGDRSDGGPDPGIFAVHVNRLRGILKRIGASGKIETVWNAGYRASPDLVEWVKALYPANIKEK